VSDNGPKQAEHNAGAFYGTGGMGGGKIPVPMRTLSDEYRDEPVDPPDDRVPVPEPPSVIRRLIDRLTGRPTPAP